MNSLSRYWLNKRHREVRKILPNHGTCLDLGAGGNPIWDTCVTVDVTGCPNVKASALNLPFQENTFDRIFCLEVIEHFHNHNVFYEEIKRVLKLEGMFVITTPVDNIFWHVLWYLWSRTFGRKWLHSHNKDFNVSELMKSFKIVIYKKINWRCLRLIVGINENRTN